MRVGIEYSAWLTILFEGLQDIVGISIIFVFQTY